MANEYVTTDAATRMRELTVPGEEGQLSRVRDFVAECCQEARFTSRETNNTKLAVDEACTNIIKHAYRDEAGDIKVRAVIGSGSIEISLFDYGRQFDFAGVKDPDLDQYVETGRKGGLGVFLINRLMDGVEYRASTDGNVLIMNKQSQSAVTRALPVKMSWRGSLRYKFTLRASLGLFVIIAAIGGYIFSRQTATFQEQRATKWLGKKSLTENIANKSKELLLTPETYSVQQTTLTAFVTRVLDGNDDLAYVRVVGAGGEILASGDVNEIFTTYRDPAGTVVLRDDETVRWSRMALGGRFVRDIRLTVRVRNAETNDFLTMGSVFLGVYEDGVYQDINDPRLFTALVILGCFLVGILLIVGLVSVFVKPIQVLTDGVRAIGEGSLDKVSVDGPAEIGAIASVFNEITEKFKVAQENVLEQEKLQKEIEVAKQIQHALLPKHHPDVSGYDIAPYYQAAKEVGGDYYDFVQVDEDTLGVVVADVSGKGVPGSLVMTMIRTALRMEARGNKNASDVMSKMNDFVTDDMKKGMFVTMFYVILDSKNRIISYASAGHNPMILFRAGTNETFFLNPKGFPVGIALPDEQLFRRSITLEKLKLKKDDMLVIYTDGVTEAMNEKREQFGEDRLVETIKKYGELHPNEFIVKLEREIKAFTGGNAQNDDITVVAVKEKLVADDVLFGIRKKLIDLVDVGGMSVKEACLKMRVSPTTYYRYKKRMAIMGERGLKNKVLREDMALRRVSIEQRKALVEIIRQNPEFGAKRLTTEINKELDPSRQLTERLVYDELKRLGLNTKDQRIDYLRRNRLLEPEVPETAETPRETADAAERTSRELVEDLIQEVSETSERPVAADTVSSESVVPEDAMRLVDSLGELDAGEPDAGESDAGEDDVGGGPVFAEVEMGPGVRIDMADMEGGVAVFKVDGHLDSVSSTTLEKKLHDVISASKTKIVVDLSAVSYISSGGWGIFVGEVQRLREASGDVVLVGMSAEVYDVYELLGFSDILRAFVTTEAALEHFAKSPEERFAPPERAAASASEREKGERDESFVDDMPAGTFAGEWESLEIEATTVGEQGDLAVISLKGIIDTISAESLRRAIDRVIGSGRCRIVIDLSLVEYVSSGGWGTFTERLREVRRQGGDIKLFGMDPDVYYVFTMLGFNIVLSSFDILSTAIEDFSRSADGMADVHPEQSDSTAAIDAPRPESDVAEGATEDDEFDDGILQQAGDLHGAIEAIEQVEWEQAGDALVARIHGMIEATSVEAIDEAVEARWRGTPEFVVFDLTDVDYISSTGWGLFAKYHEQSSAWGGRVVFSGMNQELYGVFRCLEFHAFIDTYPTVADAVETFLSGKAGEPPGDRPSARPHVSAPWADPFAGEPADEVPAEAEDEETTGRDATSIDEIIGGDVDPQPAPEPTTEAEPSPWHDASADPGPALEPNEPVEADADDSEPEPDEQPTVFGAAEPEFVDFERDPSHVDVTGAAAEGLDSEDSKLRDMGWAGYGERLRKRNKKSKDES